MDKDISQLTDQLIRSGADKTEMVFWKELALRLDPAEKEELYNNLEKLSMLLEKTK